MKDDDKKSFSIRLNELCDDKRMPLHGRQTKLAKIFGISQEAARKWLCGESAPKYGNMIVVCKYFGCQFEWLTTGNGLKYQSINNAEQVLKSLNIDVHNLTDEQTEAIKLIMKLTTDDISQVKKIIKTFLHPNGNGERSANG